jgi:hypothetical protein
MFVLKFQGSVLKVEQDSEISIGLDGVKVTPLAVQPKRIKDPMLDAISSAVGEAAEAHLKQDGRGRKVDPNSTMSRVFAYVAKLKSEGVDKSVINQRARKEFSQVPSQTLASYLYKGYEKAA